MSNNVFDNLTPQQLDEAVAIIEEPSKKRTPIAPYMPNDLSEAGAAELFAVQYKDVMRWTKALGWMVWDGKRWKQSDELARGKAMNFSKKMLEDAKRYLSDWIKADDIGEPPKDARDYLRFAQKMRNGKPIANILSLAESQLVEEAAIFDANPYDLNTPAGIVDLRTGEIRQHDPAAYCSKMTACAPFDGTEDEHGVDLFNDFLNTITDNDNELKAYLQLSAGSYTIGTIFHEGIQIAYGSGKNGKSTFYNILAAVLGDYAGSIDVNVMTTDRINKGAAKATLRGKRLITCGELEEGQRLSTQTLKQLASTDMLTIEEKYRAPETIKPTHHIIMFSNYLPRVGSTDDGTWRRIQLIPFNAVIKASVDRPNYADTLVHEAGSVILSWIITGAKMFCQNGCKLLPPESVSAATRKYREQENWLQNFINERCRFVSSDIKSPWIGVRDLYNAYRTYADESGTYRRSMPDFNRAMESAGFKKATLHGGGKIWKGIDLKEQNYVEEVETQADFFDEA